jgi:hypothetical protein
VSEEETLSIRLLKGFGRFWWDFLVGDTPEITAAVVIIVLAVTVLADAFHVNALAYVVLPLLVIATLALSLRRARKPG